MACINMLNHPDHHVPMSPRISFSNDFAVNDPPPPAAAVRRDRMPVDPDFEFSPVGSRPMMAADELFFKGRMLPLRGGGGGETTSSSSRLTTLREELRSHEDYEGSRPPKASSSSSFFKLIGLKKPNCSNNNNSSAKRNEPTA